MIKSSKLDGIRVVDIFKFSFSEITKINFLSHNNRLAHTILVGHLNE